MNALCSFVDTKINSAYETQHSDILLLTATVLCFLITQHYWHITNFNHNVYLNIIANNLWSWLFANISHMHTHVYMHNYYYISTKIMYPHWDNKVTN